MAQLGTLEELPDEYLSELKQRHMAPLWPSLRSMVPHGAPQPNTQPTLWSYNALRPLLLQAGELTPIEKAERRVLMFCNPGLGFENAMATPSIYLGMQLILPGETAPNHRHTPSAIRFVVEGQGGFTMVEGEKLIMEPGDLILTPSGLWHEHGHEGDGPVVWLDALDLPVVWRMEASYAIEGESQGSTGGPDASQTDYRRSGLMPYDALRRAPNPYPMLRYPWREVRATLHEVAASRGADELVHLAYVNPETGEECLPIMGFSAIMLRPGEERRLARRSCSAVMHGIEGQGQAQVNGVGLNWEARDTWAIPPHAEITIRNGSSSVPAFIFLIDDAPMQRRLGYYEEFSENA